MLLRKRKDFSRTAKEASTQWQQIFFSLAHLQLLWAMLSLLQLLWVLTRTRHLCKERQAPLFPKEDAQINQQCLKLKWKFSEAKVTHRANRTASACALWRCLGCAPELCCQTNAVSGAARPTGLCLSAWKQSHKTPLRIKSMFVKSLILAYRNLLSFKQQVVTKIVQEPTVTFLWVISPFIHDKKFERRSWLSSSPRKGICVCKCTHTPPAHCCLPSL